MNKLFSFFLFLLSSVSLFALSEREERLIAHVKMSIEKGKQKSSKLNEEILDIDGMSSPKVRHFLNNLCSLPDANYLEIGCWKGSTWISALYGNEETLSSAVAIDNWSQFGNVMREFYGNCSKFLHGCRYYIYSEDCFKLDLRWAFARPIDIYFFDGDHQALSQELAFTYYDPILEDSFIAVVDDWNWESVQRGTRSAFEKLGYEVLFEEALPAKAKGSDKKRWWNGLYVAVIRKP